MLLMFIENLKKVNKNKERKKLQKLKKKITKSSLTFNGRKLKKKSV